MELHIAEGHTDEAAQLIKKYHYSHRIPANIQLCVTWHLDGGLFGDLGKAIAACTFSIPPTRWNEPVFELSRLVRIEGVDIKLTGLISQACNMAKKNIDMIVSFADWTQGHHGGIYQACSWNYAGKREKRMDGLMIDGVFVPGRSCNSKYGTQSPTLLKDKIDNEIEAHYDEGKYLYWRAITRKGIEKAKRLQLESLPYPKPGEYK